MKIPMNLHLLRRR